MIWPLLRASDLRVTPENGRIGIANKTIVKKLSFAPAVSEGGGGELEPRPPDVPDPEGAPHRKHIGQGWTCLMATWSWR